MLIKIKKETEETIEIKTPSFYKNEFAMFKITNTHIVKVSPSLIYVSSNYFQTSFDLDVSNIVFKNQPVSELDFMEWYEKSLMEIANTVNEYEKA